MVCVTLWDGCCNALQASEGVRIDADEAAAGAADVSTADTAEH